MHRLPTGLLLWLSACAAGSSSSGPTLTASGSGEVTVLPTKVRISVGVTTHAARPATASKTNSAAAEAVLAAIRSFPNTDSARVTSVAVSPNQTDAGHLVDYEATTSLEVLLHSLDSAGSLLQTALQAGATSVESVRFESDSSQGGHERALAQAYERAKADAATLAAAARVHLGPISTLSTGQPWSSSYAYEEASVTANLARAEFGNATSGVVRLGPTPQAIRVSATVTASWRVAE